MGVVYAAYHEEFDRRVAIKLVHRSVGESSDGHARILREAQALARLSHHDRGRRSCRGCRHR
ncbi:MAG: hypothetical protein IPK80_21340 [Nannocystis sp.]|nr:hypothetical protein [Nannocystis sp.]